MRHDRRYFYVTLRPGGKLSINYELSYSARKKICDNKENKSRPITMEEWKNIPAEMKTN